MIFWAQKWRGYLHWCPPCPKFRGGAERPRPLLWIRPCLSGIRVIVRARGHATLFFYIYKCFLIVFCQLMCAESKSDVCQFVNVDHFFYGMKSKMADKKISFFVKTIKTLHLDPLYV